MAEHRDPSDSVALGELTTANVWGMAVLVEVLEQKSVLTRLEIYDVIQELRAQKPRPPHLPPPLSNPKQAGVTRIIEVIDALEMTNQQAKMLLAQGYRIVEAGLHAAENTAPSSP